MNTNHLYYFWVTAQHLNISKAAEILFISQPALSRQIEKFERELGTILFLRKNRGLELTEAGRYLFDQAEKIMLYENTLLSRLHEKTPVDRPLKMEYTGPSLTYKITGFLVHFGNLGLKRDFVMDQVDWNTLRQDLRQGGTDLAICALHGLIGTKGIDYQSLFTSSCQICISSRNRLSSRGWVTFDELRDEVFILPNTPLSEGFVKFELHERGRKHGFIPRINMEHKSYATILPEVVLNHGIAPIMRSSFPKDLPENIRDNISLIQCDELSAFEYVVAWNKELYSDRLREVIDELTNYPWPD